MDDTVVLDGRSAARRHRRRSASMLLVGSLTLLVSAAACGSDDDGSEPGPVDSSAAASALGPVRAAAGEPVKIGIVSDGRSAAIDNSVQFDVAEATAKYLNEHRGGIGGRPVELVTCETQADPAKATDCGNQMIENDVVAVAVGESGVGDSVWEPLAAADVPVMLYGATNPTVLSDPTTFTVSDPNFGIQQLPIAIAKAEKLSKVTSVVIDVPALLHNVEEVAPRLMEEAGLDYQLVRVPPGTADMTPQLQGVVGDEPSMAFVVGNDSFCISAFNGLKAVGYDGPISAISQCITDATRDAVPGDVLDGMTVAASMPTGGDDPSTVLYNAVLETYGKDIDASSSTGRGMFVTFAGLAVALEGITGDVTPATAATAISSMPEKELPGAGGLRFRCNGKAFPETPAVCVRGGLTTVLDNEGQSTAFKVVASSPIPD
ncbi:ABC transporter substrate-binding protein [Parafrankia sp. FMc2]|uniref:ABC transporter substrate-binding protein n=1 Tax=Parafrankia sp. FMc2 TaxID=3233196 RepID=UPI0034D58DD5